jgi:hypothetical protein
MRKTKSPIGNLGRLALLLLTAFIARRAQGQAHLYFDGNDNYVQVPDSSDFSVAPGGVTVSVWMKPSALTFPKTEGSDVCQKFVHWMGKGEGSGPDAQQEWVFRMYSLNPACPTPDPAQRNPRQSRISFYVYNLAAPPGHRQNEGVGSYFQEPVTTAEWMHVVGVAYYDPNNDQNNLTAIYKNGELKYCSNYRAITGVHLEGMLCHIGHWPDTGEPIVITPEHGNAPLRLGTREGRAGSSYFLGGLARVRLWNRPLGHDEINSLIRAERCLFDPSTECDGTVPSDALAAEWLLNEDSGPNAYDTVGGHDGTIVRSYRPVH